METRLALLFISLLCGLAFTTAGEQPVAKPYGGMGVVKSTTEQTVPPPDPYQQRMLFLLDSLSNPNPASNALLAAGIAGTQGRKR